MLGSTIGAVLVVMGFWVPETSAEIAGTMIFFFTNALGGYWMIYQAIRYESPAGKFVALALIPMCFLWYYVTRVRPSKRTRRSKGATNAF